MRVVTLCWNYDNEVCDSVAGKRTHHGLSPFGLKVVERMQELGMVIDLSHASDETFEDVLSCVNSPLLQPTQTVAPYAEIPGILPMLRSFRSPRLAAL